MFEYGIMLIQGEGGPKRPTQGRRYLERAAALGQVDALKVLAYALSHGQYSYEGVTHSGARSYAVASSGPFAPAQARRYQELIDARRAVVRVGADGCGLGVFRHEQWSAA